MCPLPILDRSYPIINELFVIAFSDLHDYGRALEYISGLEFGSAESSMSKYGGTLMQNLPDETVAFLKVLCTDYRKATDPAGETGSRTTRQSSNPDNYLHHFFKRPSEAIDFLEHILHHQNNTESATASSLVFNSLLENYLQVNKNKECKNIKNARLKPLTITKHFRGIYSGIFS